MKCLSPNSSGWKRIVAPVIILISVALLMGNQPCGVGIESGSSADVTVDAQLEIGDEALRSANIHGARDAYIDALSVQPDNSHAAFGRAFTELLLLPESDASTQLLRVLGADPNQLPLNLQRDLYGDWGIIDLAARHVEESHIEGRFLQMLPFPEEAADYDLNQFVENVVPADVSIEDLREPLLALMVELDTIVRLLQIAERDPSFFFVIEGETFHCTVDIRIGHSEVAVLLGAIRTLQGLVFTTLAYDWSVGLHDVLGTQSVLDRATALNAIIFRDIAHPELLSHARTLYRDALSYWHKAVEYGRQAPTVGALEWYRFEYDDLQVLADLTADLADAVDGEVLMRHTNPDTRLDLTSLFMGLLIEDGDPPLVEGVVDQENGDHLAVSDEGLKAFLIDPLFDPSFLPTEESAPTFFYGFDFDLDRLREGILSSTIQEIKEYFRL